MYECVGPGDWLESSVFDLAHWKNGLAFKNIDFSETGRPVIKIAELKNGVTSQTARTRADYDPSVFVKPGDMLFSWSGNRPTPSRSTLVAMGCVKDVELAHSEILAPCKNIRVGGALCAQRAKPHDYFSLPSMGAAARSDNSGGCGVSRSAGSQLDLLSDLLISCATCWRTFMMI